MAFFAVFLPAGAFADFFAVAAVFFAAIVTTPLRWVPGTVADSLAPKMRPASRIHSVDPLLQTDDLSSARFRESAEHLGSSICGGLVRGLEKVVNPIPLIGKPLSNYLPAQPGLKRPQSFDVKL